MAHILSHLGDTSYATLWCRIFRSHVRLSPNGLSSNTPNIYHGWHELKPKEEKVEAIGAIASEGSGVVRMQVTKYRERQQREEAPVRMDGGNMEKAKKGAENRQSRRWDT